MHESWLQDFLLFFAAAGLVAPIFHRAGLGPVLGFLLVGVAVGPYGLGRFSAEHPWLSYLVIEDRARVEPFAELGVMFLLFIVGLELSLRKLWSLRRFVFGIGGAQVAVAATALAFAAMFAGVSGEPAVVIGLALAMSSTAIVIQLLEEQGRSATTLGRLALSVLLFQDLMVAPTLFIAGVLGRGGDNFVSALAWALLQAVTAVALIVLVGRFALRPLLRFTARTGSRDLIMAIAVLMVVAVAAATGLAGLSTALGAFLAGLLLAETEYRHQLEVDLTPFKGLLIGVFFVTVGMTLDVVAVWQNFAWIAASVVGLLLLKAAILFAAARAFGRGLAVSAELALLLSQAGEFAFVVLGLGRGSGLIDAESANFLTAVAVLSMIATPALAVAARRIGDALTQAEHRQHAPGDELAELEDHVVIGGFGRVGQTVAQLLEAEHIRYVAFDTNAELVADHNRQRRGQVYLGDASRPEMLRRVNAGRARAFVVTVNSVRAAERMIKAVRELQPQARVLARAKDAEHAGRLAQAGADEVIPEAVEASLQLAGRVLEALGVPDEAVIDRIGSARAVERERLQQATGNA